MTAPAPKPCPFCGEVPNIVGTSKGWAMCATSLCPVAGVNVPLTMWNRRPQQSAEPMANERGRFEEWAQSNVGQPSFAGYHIRDGAWAYHHNIMQTMWECWQDARRFPAASPGPSELVEEMEKLADKWDTQKTGARSIAGAEVRCSAELRALITRHRGKS